MYLHCDTTAGAYLRVLCDAVFGYGQCRNEIEWKRTSAHNRARRFGPVHDRILLYSRRMAINGTRFINRMMRNTLNGIIGVQGMGSVIVRVT